MVSAKQRHLLALRIKTTYENHSFSYIPYRSSHVQKGTTFLNDEPGQDKKINNWNKTDFDYYQNRDKPNPDRPRSLPQSTLNKKHKKNG